MSSYEPVRGVACPGCPHRAAFVAVKEALGRGRGRVYCGDAGCPVVGPLHPAATTCPGGEERLLPRYRQAVPDGTEEPRARVCAHFVTDRELASLETPRDAWDHRLDHLDREGDAVLLCVLASSRPSLDGPARARLAERTRELGAARSIELDPFDTLACAAAIDDAQRMGGVSALIFFSPCVQLMERDAFTPSEIDRYTCVGCQRCAQIIGCPALGFVPPVCRIDADSCAGCDLCADYCRTNVIYSDRQRQDPRERHERRLAAVRR